MPEDKAIVRHCATIYATLLAQARKEGEFVIWRGKITKMYAETGVPQSYYSAVFKQLEDQGCITYAQKGTRSVESVLVLDHEPTPEGFIPPPPSPLTDPERYANLREDVEALKILVGGINIAEALIEIERRLKEVEESHSRKDSVTSTDIVQ